MGMVLQVDSGGDMSVYLSYPRIWKNLEWNRVFGERDYLFPILAKSFSYISIDGNFFGMFIYVIYATLYLQSFKILTEEVSNQSTVWYYLSTFAIFLIFPYSRVFAMRFSLASLMYIWFVLEIVIKKNKLYYWLLPVVPLLHYSFLTMIIILFLHLFFRKRLTLCLLLFFVSFSFNNPQVAYYMNGIASSVLPERTSSVVSSYASEEGLDYMNNRDAEGILSLNAKGAFLMAVQNGKTDIIMFAMVLMVLVSFKKIKKAVFLSDLFTYLLLSFAMCNITSSASRGDRFFDVACTLTVFFLFLMSHYHGCEPMIKQFVSANRFVITIVLIIAIIYGVLYNYAMRWDYDYVLMLFGNPILAILKIIGIFHY